VDTAPPSATPLEVNLFLGLQGVVDGSGAVGRQGATARVGVAVGMLELGLAGAMSLPNGEQDGLGELSIARHDAAATLALRTGDRTRAWWLGASAGVALFHRRTRAGSDLLAGSESSLTPSLTLSPEVGFAWMPGSFGLGVRAGLDIMPAPPSFVYAGDGAPDEPAYEPPAVAPRIAIGLQARLM
jgi:hypothetical protein